MHANPPYSVTATAPRILDLTPTLLTSPINQPDVSGTHSATLVGAGLPPLDFLLLAARLAELYEMVFPDHPAWLDEEIVDWTDEGAVADAVERFLGRVSTLFPVHDEIWDVDLEVVEWRLYEIPVMPMGFDEWYDGFDDLKEPTAYLLHMRYSRGETDHPHRRDEFADLYADHLVPRYLEPHRMVAVLRELVNQHGLPEPLAALPDLLEMLDHSTGNVWIDVGEMSLADGGGYPLWERENIDWLAGEWEQAKPVLDRIHRLLDWQNGTPEEIGFKLSAVREVLLDAHQKMTVSPAEPDPLPEEQPDESTT